MRRWRAVGICLAVLALAAVWLVLLDDGAGAEPGRAATVLDDGEPERQRCPVVGLSTALAPASGHAPESSSFDAMKPAAPSALEGTTVEQLRGTVCQAVSDMPDRAGGDKLQETDRRTGVMDAVAGHLGLRGARLSGS